MNKIQGFLVSKRRLLTDRFTGEKGFFRFLEGTGLRCGLLVKAKGLIEVEGAGLMVK